MVKNEVSKLNFFHWLKNDDLLDGLWYSIINARAPLSSKIDANSFEEETEEKREFLGKKIIRSWITGQRV